MVNPVSAWMKTASGRQLRERNSSRSADPSLLLPLFIYFLAMSGSKKFIDAIKTGFGSIPLFVNLDLLVRGSGSQGFMCCGCRQRNALFKLSSYTNGWLAALSRSYSTFEEHQTVSKCPFGVTPAHRSHTHSQMATEEQRFLRVRSAQQKQTLTAAKDIEDMPTDRGRWPMPGTIYKYLPNCK